MNDYYHSTSFLHIMHTRMIVILSFLLCYKINGFFFVVFFFCFPFLISPTYNGCHVIVEIPQNVFINHTCNVSNDMSPFIRTERNISVLAGSESPTSELYNYDIKTYNYGSRTQSYLITSDSLILRSCPHLN